MSVSSHLQIQIEEYDARIRTFVPWYEDMLSVVAESLRLLSGSAPKIIDIGIGTGALAARCLNVIHDARIVGIDTDEAMLKFAEGRLATYDNIELVKADFLDVTLPPCKAIIASIALHHIMTAEAKQAFYTKCHTALEPGGILVSADCFLAKEERLARVQRKLWLEHLERTYTASESEAYLAAWAGEDRYFPLQDELEWLRQAGFAHEVLWRNGSFAVVLGS